MRTVEISINFKKAYDQIIHKMVSSKIQVVNIFPIKINCYTTGIP
jgi:hypothetical protein